MAGVKGRSGRRRSDEAIYKRTMGIYAEASDDVALVIVEKARAGDKECAFYVMDRLYGRPRQEIDARVKTDIGNTPADYAVLAHAKVLELQHTALGLPPGTVVDGEVVPHLEDEPDTEPGMADGTDDDSVSEVTADNAHYAK